MYYILRKGDVPDFTGMIHLVYGYVLQFGIIIMCDDPEPFRSFTFKYDVISGMNLHEL